MKKIPARHKFTGKEKIGFYIIFPMVAFPLFVMVMAIIFAVMPATNETIKSSGVTLYARNEYAPLINIAIAAFSIYIAYLSGLFFHILILRSFWGKEKTATYFAKVDYRQYSIPLWEKIRPFFANIAYKI